MTHALDLANRPRGWKGIHATEKQAALRFLFRVLVCCVDPETAVQEEIIEPRTQSCSYFY